MNNQIMQWLAEIKLLFFSCLETDGGELKYEKVVKLLLEEMKDFLGAKEASFYKLNPWKQELFLDITTNQNLHFLEVSSFSKKEVEEIFDNKVYIYGNAGIDAFKEYDLLISLRTTDQIYGILALKEDDQTFLISDVSIISVISVELSKLIQVAINMSKIVAEEQRYRQLYRVTEKFHSSMNMDDVLGEIIYTLREVYPSFTYFLLLSHDNNNHSNLPIKDLEYDSENIAAMQAYVTGTSQFEDSKSEKKSVLYAPLKGKQGVYGVLQVISPNTLMFPKNEVEFITLLANTAGSALENAQLYYQSKRLITDLQLINETSHRLNSNLRLSETMNYMRDQISKSFDAQEVGFIMYTAENEVKVLPGSSKFFENEQSKSYIHYIKERINQGGEALFLGDLPIYLENRKKYHSIMAVPMVQSEDIKGFAIVMHQDAYHFSFDMFKLLQSLIHHSTLALTNSILREELEKMVVTDHLTKLFSRSYLDQKLTESLKTEHEGTFVLIDIDNFKDVNDTYGHQIGDEILVQVSNIIRSNIRVTDIGCRWGGEELAIYLPKVSIGMGQLIAERIREKIEMQTRPQVTISCGISYWNMSKEDNVHALFKRADIALYEAKSSGKNKVLLESNWRSAPL